ncbi:MAG: hypothetical protein JKY98_04540 [Gammaproteobacteria bacterium]|nr:hypothetical protein [Gammaproteobacteria bacterium]
MRAAGSKAGVSYNTVNSAIDSQGNTGAGVFEAGLIDAINQLFSEFAFAYHNQYHKAFPDNESVAIAKEYWLSCLAEFSPSQITHAARKLVKSSEFLPTVSAVVKACDSGVELFGLPAPRQAYLEACRAPSPKAAQKWSHEAVYHAGKASDWYILSTESEAVALPIFKYNYHQICQRVMQGEKLDIELPQALEQKEGRKLSPAERHECMAKLREELGL